jgi:hypothetical protein
MTSDEQRWVVAPDEARIEVAVGPEATVSPELRDALDNLARVLEQQQEVQGYMKCDSVSWEPCAWLFTCGKVSA